MTAARGVGVFRFAVGALASVTLAAGGLAGGVSPAFAARSTAARTTTAPSSAATSSGSTAAATTAGGVAVRSTSGQSAPVTAALPVGASLASQASLTSGTGYQLVMQPDGNLVESGLGRVLWSSRTHVPGSHVVMQTNGNLVIYSPAGVAQWATDTTGQHSAGVLLTAGGDLVMDSTTGAQLWDDQVSASGLAPTGRLTAGQVITSPDGGTLLATQRDGNVVLQTRVATAWVVLWSTNTSGHPGSYLRMRADGNLVVLDPKNVVLWASATGTPAPVHFTVENGGNARIEEPTGELVASVGDDYPANLRAAQQDSLVDPWGYYNRECVSFAAWRALEEDHVTVWYAGSAYQWAGYAKRHGYLVDTDPTPGSVAWTNAGRFGHVAMVEKVLGPYLVVEEYNYLRRGTYSHRVVLASAFRKFLHFELPATNAPTAPDAEMSATVGPGVGTGRAG